MSVTSIFRKLKTWTGEHPRAFPGILLALISGGFLLSYIYWYYNDYPAIAEYVYVRDKSDNFYVIGVKARPHLFFPDFKIKNEEFYTMVAQWASEQQFDGSSPTANPEDVIKAVLGYNLPYAGEVDVLSSFFTITSFETYNPGSKKFEEWKLVSKWQSVKLNPEDVKGCKPAERFMHPDNTSPKDCWGGHQFDSMQADAQIAQLAAMQKPFIGNFGKSLPPGDKLLPGISKDLIRLLPKNRRIMPGSLVLKRSDIKDNNTKCEDYSPTELKLGKHVKLCYRVHNTNRDLIIALSGGEELFYPKVRALIKEWLDLAADKGFKNKSNAELEHWLSKQLWGNYEILTGPFDVQYP